MTQQLLLFSAYNAALKNGLWSLDTATHSNQIDSTDLFPTGFVGYNEAVYFNGFTRIGSGGRFGLWVTDGSSAHEITGIANTPAAGLDPFTPIVFNNLMYFGGNDTAGHPGLWVSDGIAADTHEIVPANASSTGVFSNGALPYFTVYNGSLHFAGQDASNHTVLWTSGGTAATTNVVPVPGLEGPSGLVSFNGSLYFDGMDPSGDFNLWQSDGTAAGTHELIVADASSFGLLPRDLTPYASPTLGTTRLYFNGLNADARSVLFATDGTAAGTHEITGIAGASTALNPSDITVYNGRLYFDGHRADGETSLWVSDGTAAGTHEIVVPGANYGGSDGGFSPNNLTVFNGLLYFSGTAASGVASGNRVLWVTDGTTVNQVPLGPSALSSPEPDGLFAASLGAPDAHWAASIDVGSHPAGWVPTGIGDFNKDATSDLAWYNPATGDIDIWKLSSGHWAGSLDIGSHPAGYQPVGFGDYNHDGINDVLWFNPTTRDVDLWKIDHEAWAGSVAIGTHPAGYVPSGVGDFNGDGTSDVLWYNPTTRDVDLWKITNGQWAGSVDIGTHPAGFQPSVFGDFNGDGTTDIVWFNTTTGAVDIWKIANGQWAGSVDVGPHPAGWQPLGAGDFNKDGTSDIVWYNPTTNNIDLWLMKNAQWAGSVNVGSHPSSWTAVGIGDFDHNGVSDIMWRDTTTGHIENWMMAFS